MPEHGFAADSLRDDVSALYDEKLKDLFLFFHQNPELSTMEHQTSARLADELESLGYSASLRAYRRLYAPRHRGGAVSMPADMDGLPVEEKSDCPRIASEAGRPQRQ